MAMAIPNTSTLVVTMMNWYIFLFFSFTSRVDSALSVFCVRVMSFCISRQVQVEVQHELKIIQVRHLTIFIQSIGKNKDTCIHTYITTVRVYTAHHTWRQYYNNQIIAEAQRCIHKILCMSVCCCSGGGEDSFIVICRIYKTLWVQKKCGRETRVGLAMAKSEQAS